MNIRPSPLPAGEIPPRSRFRGMAIIGIPGAGKTTLAARLSSELGYDLVTSHDIVMRVDPAAIQEGRMADHAQMRIAFVREMDEHKKHVIIDGFPRTFEQAGLIEESIAVFMLWCRVDVAKARLLARGRVDDTPELIERRISEQTVLLEAGLSDGWASRRATWQRSLNVTSRGADEVFERVIAYWYGQKSEIS